VRFWDLAATRDAPERSAIERLLVDPVKAARHEELGGLEMQRGVEWLAVVRAVEDELTIAMIRSCVEYSLTAAAPALW